jgi:hypothetical protein
LETITLRRGLKTVKIEINNDHECLTADCYAKFNRYLLLENSIGSSVEDFTEKHLNPVYTFIRNDKKQEAFEQLNNLRQLFFMILNEIDVNTMAFCCLVHSINGVIVEDYSEGTLKEMCRVLGRAGLTRETVKKKLQKFRNT